MSKDRRATPGERMALGTNGPELRSEANAGGDLSSYCEGCDEERDDPHTWRECAKRLQSERDAYLDRACHFEGHLLAPRADAEALIAAPDMGRAVALAEAVRRLGGGEP